MYVYLRLGCWTATHDTVTQSCRRRVGLLTPVITRFRSDIYTVENSISLFTTVFVQTTYDYWTWPVVSQRCKDEPSETTRSYAVKQRSHGFFLCLRKLCAVEAIMFLLYPVVPISVPRQHRHLFGFSHEYCTDFDLIWGVSPYDQHMNSLHFGRNCTMNKKAPYDRKFESTSNRC